MLCTIGPASSSEAALAALAEAGMDVARLNFSHGDREEHGRVLARVRRLTERRATPIAVLMDLQGPKVRIGELPDGHVTLAAGDRFTLTTRPNEGSAERVSVSYAGLPGEVAPGQALLLGDGLVELRVVEVRGEEIRCEVVTGGRLGSRKGVNVPSGLAGLPILGDKDLDDLRFGLERGVDYVGLSFVRSAADVRAARRHIAALGAEVPVIAKIETAAALDDLDEILRLADAVMVARGDLSIQTHYARVPLVQKRLIARANELARPAITATQMLYSMVAAPQPTRAEVADVANAILDGSSAVMLSEETATGQDPVRAVRVMDEIARETEGAAGPRALAPIAPIAGSDADALARAACELAGRLGVDLIVAPTASGETARLAARYRPAQPILALTPEPATYRRLALVRGVIPALAPGAASGAPDPLEAARQPARAHGFGGRRVVVVARDRLWTGRL